MDDDDRIHILGLVLMYGDMMAALDQGTPPWWLYRGRAPEASRANHAAFVDKVRPLLPRIDWLQAVDDFERFLRLAPPAADTNHCPTLTIDVVWHAVLADDGFYARLCAKLGVAAPPHCVHDRSAAEDAARFGVFLRAFEREYGRQPHCPPFDDDDAADTHAAFAAMHQDLSALIDRLRSELRVVTVAAERGRAARLEAKDAAWRENNARLARERRERRERFEAATGVPHTSLREELWRRRNIVGEELVTAARREFRLRRAAEVVRPRSPITRQGSRC